MNEHAEDKAYAAPEERRMELKKKDSLPHILMAGILFENPALVLVLGTCPLLAITISAKDALFMGFAVIFVQVGSMLFISMLRKAIPDKVRIPIFITVIAGFVTIVQMLVSAYFPALNDTLGIYIPLIVVNCIVLARAEAYASKKPVLASVVDGLGMGVGFTVALLMMGTVREILGNGTFFGMQLPFFGTVIEPMMFFILPPGGFFVYGLCICFTQMVVRWYQKKKGNPVSNTPVIGHCDTCGSCTACETSEGKNI